MNGREYPFFSGSLLNQSQAKEFHDDLTDSLLHSIPASEVKRLFSWKQSEVDNEFVAFLDVYVDMRDAIPKDYAIIDLGCYQAWQANYFKEHARYIGVDSAVPSEWRLQQGNSEYYECSIQDFIRNSLPELVKEGLDLEHTLAICSYVPDKEARNMVCEAFPFHRVFYVGQPLREQLPNDLISVLTFEDVCQAWKEAFLGEAHHEPHTWIWDKTLIANGKQYEVAMYWESDNPSYDDYADFSVALFHDADNPEFFYFRDNQGEIEYLGNDFNNELRSTLGLAALPEERNASKLIKSKQKEDFER